MNMIFTMQLCEWMLNIYLFYFSGLPTFLSFVSVNSNSPYFVKAVSLWKRPGTDPCGISTFIFSPRIFWKLIPPNWTFTFLEFVSLQHCTSKQPKSSQSPSLDRKSLTSQMSRALCSLPLAQLIFFVGFCILQLSDSSLFNYIQRAQRFGTFIKVPSKIWTGLKIIMAK